MGKRIDRLQLAFDFEGLLANAVLTQSVVASRPEGCKNSMCDERCLSGSLCFTNAIDPFQKPVVEHGDKKVTVQIYADQIANGKWVAAWKYLWMGEYESRLEKMTEGSSTVLPIEYDTEEDARIACSERMASAIEGRADPEHSDPSRNRVAARTCFGSAQDYEEAQEAV